MQGIKVRILGDCGPFSKQGISISYKIEINGENYLIDCGAPLFKVLDYDEIANIKGVFITHSHDDHRRWLTDLALFRFYVTPDKGNINVYASDIIQEEIYHTSKAALERSLSQDSKKIIETPFSLFVNPITIGPKPKYKFLYVRSEQDPRITRTKIVDSDGNDVPPDKAKIFLHEKTTRPRMLFKDPETNLWVEPEIFYDYSNPIFYHDKQNPIITNDGNTKFTIEKTISWHGLPTNSIIIETKSEKLLFSSDTYINPDLFEEFATQKRKTDYQMSEDDFQKAEVIVGDINDYNEQYWSKERYERYKNFYKNCVVIHDIAGNNSVVHTDYQYAHTINAKKILFVHSPDRFVTLHPNSFKYKTYRIIEDNICEEVNNLLYKLDADVFYKNGNRFYVGYKNNEGHYKVVEKKDKILDIMSSEKETQHKELFRVDLYIDIKGQYYPMIAENKYQKYSIRPDKKVEILKFTQKGSTGQIIKPIQREAF